MKRKADILVVDDDSQVVELFSGVLRAEGYRVREAMTGEQGLESARAEHPDVMLLDVRLPDLSGIEVCRRMKAEPALADVFVIMVSGEAISPAEKVDALEVGADEYLAKPVELNELLARIRTALRLRDTTAAFRVSEEYHRRLIEILPDALFVLDSSGRIVKMNSRALAMLGYAEAAELQQESIVELVRPEGRERLRADIAALAQTGVLQNAEYEVARKGGGFLSIELSAVSLAEPYGQPQGFVLVARSIAERKWAEGQIRLLANALQSTHEVVYVADERLRIQFVNRAALGAYGYREEELLGRSPDFLHSPNNPPGHWQGIFEQAIQGRWTGELLHRRKDGSEFPVAFSTSQIKDSKGGTVGLVCVARDISEQKRAEKQRTVFSDLGYLLSAAATPEQAAKIILEIASEILGYDAGYIHLYSQVEDKIILLLAVDTVGGQRMPILPSGLTCDPTPLIRQVMKEGPLLTDRGDPLSVGVDLPPFAGATGRSACRMHVPIRASGVVHGILSIQSYRPGAYSQDDLGLLETLAGHCGGALQRIKVAEALRETEARYRSIFEKATEGIFQTTLEGRFLNGNPAQARMLGYETFEELKSGLTDAGQQLYVNPARRKELIRLLEEKSSVQGFEAELRRKDGRNIWVTMNAHLVRDTKGAVLYLEGTAQDVTERKRLEKVILEVSEREQRRVAQDIHDGLCQRLFCMALGCNQLRQNLAAQSRSEAEEAARIMAQIDAAISEARSVAYGLSLANLDKRGLAGALRDLASTSSVDFRIACVAECPDSVSIGNPATANHLYRIAREAVHNALKHAKPSRIVIRLEAMADGGCLSVVDDGSGIPEASRAGSGMGLDMMRYRANMVGGGLTIQKAPSGGTIIACRFPGNA
ncbi:MAG: PAS domain S-box protein [Verrucomicrobiota bacterium]